MADHKNQHFVPRTYLKRFTAGPGSKSITLFNIPSRRIIRKAPIKTQCSRPYFYGSDLEIEKRLQEPEGLYDQIVRRIERDGFLGQRRLRILTQITNLQMLRTEVSIRNATIIQSEMADLIFERTPDRRPEKLRHEEVCRMAISLATDVGKYLNDLDQVIIENPFEEPFYTSDSPAFTINKLYANRKRQSPFGHYHAGLIIGIPLTPKFFFLAYDRSTYAKIGCDRRFKLRSFADLKSMNAIQIQNSDNNVYLPDKFSQNILLDLAKSEASNRLVPRFRVNYAIRNESKSHDTAEFFTVVHTAKERAQSDNGLVHLENIPRHPSRFPSFVRYSTRPKFIDTETRLGYVRPATLPIYLAEEKGAIFEV